MREVLFVSVLCLSLVTGCATTFERDRLRDEIGVTQPSYDQADIEKMFQRKTNLPKPFTVAVYFKPSANRDWRWTLEDKRRFIKALRDNISEEYISKIFLMNDLAGEDTGISSLPEDERRRARLEIIRRSAARYQADSVLVVDGTGAVAKGPNRWGASYLLVAPMLFVNGTSMSSFFAMNATLWDVRSEVLYMSFNSEGERKNSFPLALGRDTQHYFNEAKLMALADMEKSLSADLKSYRPTP